MTLPRLKQFVKDKYIFIPYGIGALIAVSALYFMWPLFRYGGNIIVHKSPDGVVDALTSPYGLIAVFVLLGIMEALTVLASYLLYWRKRLWAYWLCFLAVWFLILIAVFVWRLNVFN